MSSFLESFSSHWRMKKDELSRALKECLVVIDSSVLLDLYRVTPTARDEMIKSLLTVEENLWVPHQVALEFHRNRIEAARDQLAFYDETCKSLETAQNQALQRLNEFAKRSALDDKEKSKLKEPLENAFRVAIERVKTHQGVFDLTISKVLNDDPVLKALAKLFDGKVGMPLPKEAYVKAQAEAARRRDDRIPPGYKDRAKRTNPDGDYLWWEQTLIKAAEVGKSVLIVSNDEKEDWINKRLDFPLGPREELVEEMRQRADASLRIVNFATFLEAVRLGAAVSVSRETLSQANIARRQGEEQANILRLSSAIVDEYEAFLLRVIERRENELRGKIAERAESPDDSEAKEVLDNRISSNQYAIDMYRIQLYKLREAVEGAARLGGDLILHVENKALRRSLLDRSYKARKEGSAS
ncbi:PIN-like domain-containing protein [Streptomyces sp. DSM 15324]|uniref:PIN-like domain-containing protein n=1 Tax=Streptomyces sp. DSM 15324 TaxID=1739111 RepID=UPI000B2272CD|nr:PIN-like domain-containing protein [Streptomyces sp. DSM 15324]